MRISDWSQTCALPIFKTRLIEDKANGTAIIDVLRDEIDGIIPVNPKDSKEVRARAQTPTVEAGNVLLPHPSEPGCEWVTDLLTETRNFPTGAHDDMVDVRSEEHTSELPSLMRISYAVFCLKKT